MNQKLNGNGVEVDGEVTTAEVDTVIAWNSNLPIGVLGGIQVQSKGDDADDNRATAQEDMNKSLSQN